MNDAARNPRLRAPGAPVPGPRWAGPLLAAAVVGGWIATHVLAVFGYDWDATSWLTAPPVVALQCWLSVGLFIVAHDCMHGSLLPGRPAAERAIGRLCLGLYAGFSFARLAAEHHRHHRRPGTADDPDFFPGDPRAFWPWYRHFMAYYFTRRELAILTGVVAVYLLALDVAYPNLLVFWALPAFASSVQLFYFGTYLPHRAGEAPFTDRHRTRSNEYPAWLSLLSCFHFGYHHEHHRRPHVPWWRLPAARAAS